MIDNYEAPKLTVVGSAEALTAAHLNGTVLDGNYPAGTPVLGHLS